MFNSVQQILEKYIDDVSRYNIHFVEMERGENPEDLYYLCKINNKYYVVFETDYIGSLSGALDEIKEVFSEHTLLDWLVKKTHQQSTAELQTLTDGSPDAAMREALILKVEGWPLRYMILEVMPNSPKLKHYNPNTYGQVS